MTFGGDVYFSVKSGVKHNAVWYFREQGVFREPCSSLKGHLPRLRRHTEAWPGPSVFERGKMLSLLILIPSEMMLPVTRREVLSPLRASLGSGVMRNLGVGGRT